MPIRNKHRVGDYLMRDDESGEIRYRSELVKRWDGAWVQRKGWETRQPQEFVTAKRDPYPLRHIRPEQTLALPRVGILATIGDTGIANTDLTPTDNAAAHLFTGLGIGAMAVGLSFTIR